VVEVVVRRMGFSSTQTSIVGGWFTTVRSSGSVAEVPSASVTLTTMVVVPSAAAVKVFPVAVSFPPRDPTPAFCVTVNV
jgi:hypothetical protein